VLLEVRCDEHRTCRLGEVPLTEIGSQHVIYVDACTSDERAGIRCGVDDALIEHRRRLSFTERPCLGLPRPSLARSRRAPDDVVLNRPCAHPRVTVDTGALDAKYGVDSSKPLDGNAVPGIEVDVVVDAEDYRCGVWAAGLGV
jgi:hypothetical protein